MYLVPWNPIACTWLLRTDCAVHNTVCCAYEVLIVGYPGILLYGFCLAVWLAYFCPSCCVWSRCVLLSRASWRVRVYRRIVVSLVRPLAKNLSTLLSPPFIYSLKYVLVGYLRGNQNTKTRHRYPHRPTPTFMNAGPLCCLFVLYVHHEREPRPTSQ